MIKGLLSIPLFAATKKLWHAAAADASFRSEYILDVSTIKNAQNFSIEHVVSEMTRKVLDSEFIQAGWFERCSDVQKRYLKEGLLLSSQREMSIDGTQISFVTIWRNKESFLSFFKETEFYRLDYAYIAAGLSPKMAKSYRVFPKSPEAYFLLQKS